MSSDWPVHKLSDFINVKHGFAFKGEYFQSIRTKYLLVTPGNFAVGGGFKADKFKYYKGPIQEGYIFNEGDLVVTMTDLSKQADTLGYSALIPEVKGHRLLHNQRVGLIEFKNVELDKTYLYFLLRSREYRNHVIGGATGTTVKHTSPTKILSFEFQKPPKDVQVEIGKKLIALEEKIELNRQTNQTLEQIAQAMFKSWFVDFDPVRAKIAANAAGENAQRAAMAAISGLSITPVQAQGLAAGAIADLDQLQQQHPEQYQQLQATADLFPDNLIDSELGEIPERWEVKTLSKIIKVIGGGTPKRSEKSYWGGTIPWFSVRDVPAESDVFVIDTTEKITEAGMQKSSTKLLPKGTTIITARGTVGKLALVATPMCMNQSCYGIEAVKGIGPYFNFFNLREAIGTLLQNTHGAVFDTITTQTFESYSMAVASRELIQAFDELVEPLLKKVEQNIHETTGISELRDTLLPKLLSGELSDYARIEVHS